MSRCESIELDCCDRDPRRGKAFRLFPEPRWRAHGSVHDAPRVGGAISRRRARSANDRLSPFDRGRQCARETDILQSREELSASICHYGLISSLTLFRLLRRFIIEDPASLPLIATTCAFCRDAQFRASFALIKQLRSGELLTRERMEAFLESSFPDRFSAAMKKSLAQNVITSWTQGSHLRGKTKKIRTLPHPRLGASVYSMAAGYLLGFRGQALLSSVFVDLISPDPAFVIAHLASASGRGWIRFRQAGHRRNRSISTPNRSGTRTPRATRSVWRELTNS